jgi:hypothetical protein
MFILSSTEAPTGYAKLPTELFRVPRPRTMKEKIHNFKTAAAMLGYSVPP